MSQRPSRREDFEVAIICALPLEYDAVALLFDEFWDTDGDPFGRAAGDLNTYTTGRIGKHDVVLALLSHMGKANAASAAANMRSSYGALRLVILVGICGGVPYHAQGEMFLGDVVISSSVIQYDFGRNYPDGFKRKDTYEDNLRKHDKNIRSFLAKLSTSSGQDKLHERSAHFLTQLQEQALKRPERYRYPGITEDKLFEPSYRHKHRNSVECICRKCHGRKDPVCNEARTSSCDDLGCDEGYLVKRNRLEEQGKAQEPTIYIGTVASSDTVMKSGEVRDRIAKEENVIAFEMEGAGVWEDLPCIVVKGVCDYADCHKNKQWQDFAAATAASASKAMLEQYLQTDRGRSRLDEAAPPKGHFLVPFGRNQNFVGRGNILTRLLKMIRPDANEDDCQRTAIEGLGGVGKTQIALEAVYLLHNEHPECSIFWVPAVDATSFENAYRSIGKQLKIKEIDQDKADIKQLVDAALSEESSGSWLLVVDNADDTKLLFGTTGLSACLPFSRNGSILFTTRNHEASVMLDVPVKSIFNVTEMDGDEALSLLQNGLNKSQTSSIEATKELLVVLANLPLAIKQASAYMATKHISTIDYLELCQSKPKDMISLLSKDFEDRHRYKEIKNPVATTWLISFNQILRHDPRAAKYLKFMSILAEKDIPKALLPNSKTLEVTNAIGTLKAYAFITQREGEDLLDMHRLVRLAMRNWLEKKEELNKCITSALQRLDTVMPFPEHENRDIWMRLLPHAQAVLELSENLAGGLTEASLLDNVAESNYLLGRYQTAEESYRLAAKLRKKTLGKNHLDTLTSMNNLAIMLSELGRYQEAEKMLLQILELREKALGKKHSHTLDTMNSLAVVLRRLGRYQEAEKMHRQEWKLTEKALGKYHPDTLISMNNLALALDKLGRYEEAEQMHRQTLKLKERVLGKDHPGTLSSMNNLAVALEELARYEEAEQIHRQTLELRERVLSKDHPDIRQSRNNLKNCLKQKNRRRVMV